MIDVIAYKGATKYHGYLAYHGKTLCGRPLIGNRNGANHAFDDKATGACNRCRRVVREMRGEK